MDAWNLKRSTNHFQNSKAVKGVSFHAKIIFQFEYQGMNEEVKCLVMKQLWIKWINECHCCIRSY